MEVVEDEATSSPKGKKEKKDKKKKKKEKQEKQEDESMVVEEGASGVCKLIVNLSISDETTDNSLLHHYIMLTGICSKGRKEEKEKKEG